MAHVEFFRAFVWILDIVGTYFNLLIKILVNVKIKIATTYVT